MPSVPDPFLPSQQPATTPAIRPRDRDVLSPPPRKKVKLEGTEGVKEIRTPNMRSSRDTEAMVQSQPGVISKQREIANKPAPSFGGGSNSMPSVHVSVIVSCANCQLDLRYLQRNIPHEVSFHYWIVPMHLLARSSFLKSSPLFVVLSPRL